MQNRNEHPRTNEVVDAAVVGGGPAGLNVALMLARSRRSVVVVDAGAPRNAPAAAAHGLFARDGVAPGELLATGREEVRRYGGRVVDGEVVEVRRDDDLFTLTLAGGRMLRARRLLVTTGLIDRLPDVEGLAARWGRDVVHCPYCHGWEVRDRRIAVLASGPASPHHALLFRQLSDTVAYFTNGRHLAEEQRTQFAARGIRIIDGDVAAAVVEDDALAGLRFADGRVEACDAVAVATRLEARASFLRPLGLDVVEHPSGAGTQLAADSFGRTAVPGVWAAGNVTDLMAQVGASAAAGASAGAQINADLVQEETAAAVAALAEA
jgi:thioredoxin reductase